MKSENIFYLNAEEFITARGTSDTCKGVIAQWMISWSNRSNINKKNLYWNEKFAQLSFADVFSTAALFRGEKKVVFVEYTTTTSHKRHHEDIFVMLFYGISHWHCGK